MSIIFIINCDNVINEKKKSNIPRSDTAPIPIPYYKCSIIVE